MKTHPEQWVYPAVLGCVWVSVGVCVSVSEYMWRCVACEGVCACRAVVALTRRRGETGYCIYASFLGPSVGGCQDPQHEVSPPTPPLPYLAIPHPGACLVDWTMMNFWRPSMRMMR